MAIQGRLLSRNRLARVHCVISLQSLLSQFRRNDGRLRGINKGLINLDNFADGIASIHLANVERKIKAEDLLVSGKKKYSGGSPSTSNLRYFLKINLSLTALTRP